MLVNDTVAEWVGETVAVTVNEGAVDCVKDSVGEVEGEGEGKLNAYSVEASVPMYTVKSDPMVGVD